MIKRLIISLVLVTTGFMGLSFAIPAASVSAADIFPVCQSGTATTTDVCKSVAKQGGDTSANNNPILKILKTVISVLSYIIGIASVIVIIIAGIQMIVGGDNPQTVETARNMVLYALVGVAVAVLSQTIVVFVLKNIV